MARVLRNESGLVFYKIKKDFPCCSYSVTDGLVKNKGYDEVRMVLSKLPS